jgi:hypothetical protein
LLIFLFATASDWPVSLEIRGPQYRRRYKSQILEGREQEAMSVWRLLATQGRYDRWLPLGCAHAPALAPAEPAVGATECGGLSGLMRRFVAVDLKMLNRQRPVMRGHLFVMLPRDRIGRAFRAALEHFRPFLQDFSL